MRYPLPVLLAALGLLAGCSDSAPTAPDLAQVQPALDVSGTWEWSEVTHIRATPFGAGILGVTSEGPVTHLRCPSSGTLTVAQVGATFSGSSTQNPAVCTTRGGQTAPAPFPPTLDLVDGEIRGRRIQFSFDTGDFPCHYRGSLRVSGDETRAWRAKGGCEVPPEFGTDKIRGFVATRP